MQFYPIFALFSTLGEMNFDPDFFQVSKLSEDQNKKKVFNEMKHFFSSNSGEDQIKKKVFTRHGTLFFSEFKYRSALRCTPELNYWRECKGRPYSNYWGLYSHIIGGMYPPRVSASLLPRVTSLVISKALVWPISILKCLFF